MSGLLTEMQAFLFVVVKVRFDRPDIRDLFGQLGGRTGLDMTENCIDPEA